MVIAFRFFPFDVAYQKNDHNQNIRSHCLIQDMLGCMHGVRDNLSNFLSYNQTVN